jgi:hypothetical protein
MPFVGDANGVQTAVTVACGLAIGALALRRGPIRARYGAWDRLVV